MLRVSKLTDYATSIMTALAQQPGSVKTAAELAHNTHVAAPTVSKVLKRLARHDLVVSIRGAHGGYRLARDAGDITMAQIVSALEGPIALTECAHSHSRCVIESQCGVRTNWQKINAAVLTALQEISLAQMTTPLSDVSVAPRRIGSKQGADQTESTHSYYPQSVTSES